MRAFNNRPSPIIISEVSLFVTLKAIMLFGVFLVALINVSKKWAHYRVLLGSSCVTKRTFAGTWLFKIDSIFRVENSLFIEGMD